MRNEYDMRSAVTFLLVGLGIGAGLAVVLGSPPEGIISLDRDRESALGVSGSADIAAWGRA
jgi:hypothetical protein